MSGWGEEDEDPFLLVGGGFGEGSGMGDMGAENRPLAWCWGGESPRSASGYGYGDPDPAYFGHTFLLRGKGHGRGRNYGNSSDYGFVDDPYLDLTAEEERLARAVALLEDL